MLLKQDRAIIAILIVTDIAFYSSHNNTVSATDISERTKLPKRSIEPMLQILSRANILNSTRGPQGGYHLARPKRLISIVDIIQAISIQEKEKYDYLSFPLYQEVIKPFWQDVDQKILQEIQSKTIYDLIKEAEKKGMKRPHPTAINFII